MTPAILVWASLVTVATEYQMDTAENNDDNEPNIVNKMLLDCSFTGRASIITITIIISHDTVDDRRTYC